MAKHPIKHGERGTRYLTDTAEDVALQVFVDEELHKMGFEETVLWYATFERHASDKHRAYLAVNDRYYLALCLLGRRDMLRGNGEWLFERCREVEAEPDGYIDLWARYHFKSSIITQAGIIQEILINPNITIAIFSVTQKLAQGFLDQIKDEFERNGLLKRIFHDVLWQEPKKNAPRWSSAGGLVVKRSVNPKESTVAAYGLIDSLPTGKHHMLLVYDDLVDSRNVTNEDMIKKATTAWEMSTNLGVEYGTRKWMIGTRYSFADTYGILMERNVAEPRVYPATDTGKLDGSPVFLTPHAWNKVKAEQRTTVAAQMLQNPLMGSENTFEVTWFRPYEIRPTRMNVYIMCDPSRGANKKSDRTAIAVVGVDPNGNKYLLDGYRHRMKLSARYQAIVTLYKKWKSAIGVESVIIGYERYGQQADDEVFEEWMQRDNFYFNMEELAWPREGGQSKKHRVERLEPDFKNSRFYLPALIYNPNKGGDCLWHVGDESRGERLEVVYQPVDKGIRLVKPTPTQAKRQPTKLMQAAYDAGHSWRLVSPIKRVDEDGVAYDVTKALMDEMLLFPFAPKDDLVDATSRIYDIGATKPIARPVEDDDVYGRMLAGGGGLNDA